MIDICEFFLLQFYSRSFVVEEDRQLLLQEL